MVLSDELLTGMPLSERSVTDLWTRDLKNSARAFLDHIWTCRDLDLKL